MDDVRKELVVDAQGRVRQAGATYSEGEYVLKVKELAETSLYFFAKVVLNLNLLTKHLHLPVCNWLSDRTKPRKLLLLPRDHFKSTIGSQATPLHLIIQQSHNNIYFPGMEGSDSKILIIGESERLACRNSHEVITQLESNQLLRAFWPERVWAKPKSQAKAWNKTELYVPRSLGGAKADPTLRTVGVGGAITGSHPNVIIKDDLVTEKARDSADIMEKAIDYHVLSRALFDKQQEEGVESLEFVIGTKWANYDLYSFIEERNPDVCIMKRSIIEDSKPIFPERFNLEDIAKLEREFRGMFPLLYMNDAADPSLVDFDMSLMREFKFSGEDIVFFEDERDAWISQNLRQQAQPQEEIVRGKSYTYDEVYEIGSKEEYMVTNYR